VTVILQRSGAVIVGPPRTASRWLVQAVTAAGVPCWTAPGHQFPGQFGTGDRIVAVVRHPVGWLDSMYRTPTGAGVPLGWHVPHPAPGESLEDWVARSLDRPGCVGRFFRQWRPPGSRVIRFECLVPDLLRVLREHGEKPDAAAVWAMSVHRDGAGRPAGPWPAELARQVCAAEQDFLTAFYPEG